MKLVMLIMKYVLCEDLIESNTKLRKEKALL